MSSATLRRTDVGDMDEGMPPSRTRGSIGAMILPTPAMRTAEDLVEALPALDAAPRDAGSLTLIVRRPGVDQREVLDAGELDLTVGLVGDNWQHRPSSRMPDRSPHPDMQLNVINTRIASYLAFGDVDRQALAGDQLHVDLDLSTANLPVGTLLVFGEAPDSDPDAGPDSRPTIVVTEQPHTGCAKFVSRYGPEAMKFVNGAIGRPLRLRGLNAKVVVPGRIRPGDAVVVARP